LLVDDGVLARTPATQLRERTARLQIDVDESGAANYAIAWKMPAIPRSSNAICFDGQRGSARNRLRRTAVA
jgi:hypothetical protein